MRESRIARLEARGRRLELESRNARSGINFLRQPSAMLFGCSPGFAITSCFARDAFLLEPQPPASSPQSSLGDHPA
jgi:hypothetical protein